MPLVKPTPAASRRGWRSSSAALAAPSARPVATPCTPGATREKIHHPPVGSLALATIRRTLGDPVRLEIVRLLSDGRPRVCGEISDAMGQPASTCSYHLKLLREAGVTHARADGTLRLVS